MQTKPCSLFFRVLWLSLLLPNQQNQRAKGLSLLPAQGDKLCPSSNSTRSCSPWRALRATWALLQMQPEATGPTAADACRAVRGIGKQALTGAAAARRPHACSPRAKAQAATMPKPVTSPEQIAQVCVPSACCFAAERSAQLPSMAAGSRLSACSPLCSPHFAPHFPPRSAPPRSPTTLTRSATPRWRSRCRGEWTAAWWDICKVERR